MATVHFNEVLNALRVATTRGDEEEITRTVSEIIITGVSNAPEQSLRAAHDAIVDFDCASLIDPLTVVPALLSSQDTAVPGILSLVGEHANAKEVIVAVQEALERLLSSTCNDGNYDSEEDESRVPVHLVSLISLYASSIPRLQLRKTSALKTIRPLINDLESAIRETFRNVKQVEQGREIIRRIIIFVNNVYMWAKSASGSGSDLGECARIMKDLLEDVLACGAAFIRSALAQRTFAVVSPRLAARSAPKNGWEDGEKVMQDALHTSATLGFGPEPTEQKLNLGSMMLLAHSSENGSLSSSSLTRLLPVLMSSLQSNLALDESLSLLLKTLGPKEEGSIRSDPSPEFLVPVLEHLHPMSAINPDPATRLIAFRLLALALSRLPSLLRLQYLHSLASESDFPQMRVASVGLAKEAILEALHTSSKGQADCTDLFCSPRVLQSLGPLLLRPNPSDVFDHGLKNFLELESSEPKRLVECLSFYYVIVERDTRNLTGIRDSDTIATVEKDFLHPLKKALERWAEDSDSTSHNIMDDMMPLISLQIGLDRISEALAHIKAGN